MSCALLLLAPFPAGGVTYVMREVARPLPWIPAWGLQVLESGSFAVLFGGLVLPIVAFHRRPEPRADANP